MNAQLTSWYCPDIEDLTNYPPAQLDNFCFLFRVMVGLVGKEGTESFDIQVCTPKWLLSNMKKDEIICGRHFLIVLAYYFEPILNRIRNLIEACTGNDWDEIAEKVSRIGFWEFEDYKDTKNS